ncbi:MAG: glutathione S-transferase family protein, partial [Proteobacteria bacterium]|nr:glutathione S-transferase family protein [Pseudomonadota bacterium]
MGQLVDGKWTTTRVPRGGKGAFQRAEAGIRDWVAADGSSGFKPDA